MNDDDVTSKFRNLNALDTVVRYSLTAIKASCAVKIQMRIYSCNINTNGNKFMQ